MKSDIRGTCRIDYSLSTLSSAFPQVSVENLLDLVGYHKVENQITEIRSNLDEAVDEVKKLAALKRYNSTHSVFGTR